MPRRLHVRGLYWDGGEPGLFVLPVQGGTTEERLALNLGRSLSFVVKGPQVCLGYWQASSNSSRRCPSQRVLSGERGGQCLDCQRRGGSFYTRTGLLGEASEDANALRREQHAAYLALFGRDLVKVGVAAEARKVNRVLEQGAAASLFFAAGDGDTMRRLEADIVRRAGLTDKVTFRQKVKMLWDHPEQSEAQSVLAAHFEKIRNGCTGDQIVALSAEPQFLYNVPAFRVDPAALVLGRLHLIRVISPGDCIAGMIAGVVGSLVLLNSEEDPPCLLDTRILRGYFVTASLCSRIRVSAGFETIAKPVIQNTLF